jgi:predicted nuclease of predicted toxin-antitoxin system
VTFVVDESVDKQIVDYLGTANHTILFVAELSPGSPDEDVLTLSRRQNAVLLTADKDFGELVFRQRRTNAGVVLV